MAGDSEAVEANVFVLVFPGEDGEAEEGFRVLGLEFSEKFEGFFWDDVDEVAVELGFVDDVIVFVLLVLEGEGVGLDLLEEVFERSYVLFFVFYVYVVEFVEHVMLFVAGDLSWVGRCRRTWRVG